MKNILKIVIITILVLGVIAGTAYIFYKNMKPEKDPIVLVNYTESESKSTFNADLVVVKGHLDTVSDDRLDLIIATHDNLDEIMNTLSVYIVADGGKISDEGVINSLNAVENSRAIAQVMINEYKIKVTSNYFSKTLGFNDLYEQLCDYLTKYSRLTMELNGYIADLDVNTVSDPKYNVFDMYSRIVDTTFEDVTILSGNTSIINDKKNIVAINNYFNVNDYFMNFVSPFGKAVNDFDCYYKDCDKDLFAESFANNVASISSINDDSSSEEKATFYFKKMCGLGV